jgi:transposase
VRRNLFWLSDEQWERIEPHLPTDVRGVERADDRRVISGIVHVLKSGCRWCDCPPEYGPPTTIYNRFVRWARRGVWDNLFRELAGNGRSTDTQMIDSTHVKAHRSPRQLLRHPRAKGLRDKEPARNAGVKARPSHPRCCFGATPLVGELPRSNGQTTAWPSQGPRA